MCGMEGAIITLFLQWVMIATVSVADVWDRGHHCHRVLVVHHGCNCVYS